VPNSGLVNESEASKEIAAIGRKTFGRQKLKSSRNNTASESLFPKKVIALPCPEDQGNNITN